MPAKDQQENVDEFIKKIEEIVNKNNEWLFVAYTLQKEVFNSYSHIWYWLHNNIPFAAITLRLLK